VLYGKPTDEDEVNVPSIRDIQICRDVRSAATFVWSILNSFYNTGTIRKIILVISQNAICVHRKVSTLDYTDLLFRPDVEVAMEVLKGSEIIDAEMPGSYEAVKKSSKFAILFIQETDSLNVTGMDLGFCDGIIAVGRVMNEQQLFSRSLRMSSDPSVHQRTMPIVQIVFPEKSDDDDDESEDAE